MKKEMDIVALGELLIDFTEAGTGADGMKLFEQNPGGGAGQPADGGQPYGISHGIYRKGGHGHARRFSEKDTGKRGH